MFVKFKITADKILIFVIAVLLLAVVIVLGVALSNFKQVNNSAKMVAHTQDVILHAEKVLTLVVTNQAISRGYVMTGKGDIQTVLKKSRLAVNSEFHYLRSLTKDNEQQQETLDSIRFYLDKRLNYSDSIAAIYARDGRAAAIEASTSNEARLYTEKARSFIESLQARENILLNQRKVFNQAKSAQQNGILLLVVMFLFVLMAAFIQKFSIEFRERKLAAANLAMLNNDLEKKVLERTSELQASKERLEETFLRITDAFIALDKNWCYTFINKRAADMIRMDGKELIGKNVWDIFPDAVNSSTYHAFHKAMDVQQFVLNEDYYEPLDLWQENHIYPSPEGISVYINDISEKKRAEGKIFKANRLYFFISQVNQMIVRVKDKETLFKEACNIAVDLGKFRMAWIGMIDPETGLVLPAMFAGEEGGYLTNIKKIIAVKGANEPVGPTSTAISNNHYIVCNDIETDPLMELWRAQALERGYRSMMAIPITKNGNVAGSFNFYSSQKNFFDTSEIALLTEAAGDVSFALENFDREEQRKRAEEEIKRTNERFEMVAFATNDVIWDWNLLNNEIWWNNNYYTLFGYEKQEQKKIDQWILGIHPDDRQRVTEGMRKIIDSGEDFWHDEYRYLHADQRPVFVYDRGFVLHDKDGKP